MSNYTGLDVDWKYDDEPERELEQRCHRCYGSGSDRDGADCIYCHGYGSTITRY